MKKELKLFITLLTLVIIKMFLINQAFSQYTAEQNKMLGIEPRNEYRIEMKSVSNLPSDTLLFKSYYNETRYMSNKTHQQEVTFRFENNLVITSMKDQFKKFRIYNEIASGKDSKHEWRTFQCKDNSGSILNLTLAKEDTVDVIMFDYGSTIFWFEIESYSIPEEQYDVLANLEELGHLHDGEFGSNYTDEQVNEFLSMFGDPAILINLMLRDLYFTQDFGVTPILQKWQK